MATQQRPRAVIMDGAEGDSDMFASFIEAMADAGVEVAIAVDDDQRSRLLQIADLPIVLGRQAMSSDMVPKLEHAVGILCYSIGMDKVPPEAAAAGLEVRNIPDYCVDEVSDHALALLLAAERGIVPLARGMAEGGWAASRAAFDTRSIRRLSGRLLAVVGAGRVGRKVAAKARGFGYRTVAIDPFLPEDPEPDFPLRTWDEVLPEVDVIVLCAAMTEESRHLISADLLHKVRPGVTLVNVARGGLVDEAALAAALQDGRVRVAALDVRATEPPDPGNDPLTGLANVIATPHQAATSVEAVADLHRKAAETAVAMLKGAGRLE